MKRLGSVIGPVSGLAKVARMGLSRVGDFFNGSLAPGVPGQNDWKIRTPPEWPLLFAGPVIDKTAVGLEHSPRTLLSQVPPAVAPAKLFMNHARDEGTIFAALLMGINPALQSPELTHGAVDAVMKWVFPPHVADVITTDLYKPAGWSAFARVSEIIGDVIFRCSNLRAAKKIAASHPGRVFLSETEFVSTGVKSFLSALLGGTQAELGYILGVNHMEASSFVFGAAAHGYEGWTPLKEEFRLLVQCQYAVFVHCGTPDFREAIACSRNQKLNYPRLKACDRFLWLYAKKSDAPYPSFAPFNASLPSQYRLDLTARKPAERVVGATPYDKEFTRRCSWLDQLPNSFMPFTDNVCYGCNSGQFNTFYDAVEKPESIDNP